MYTLVVPSLSAKFIKKATRILQCSQYLGGKLDMLFELAKSVESHNFRKNVYFTQKFLI